MSERARRWGFWMLLVAVPATALLSLVLVVNATSAAGISTADGGARSGLIGLVGDDSQGRDIDVAPMVPDDVVERCLVVSALGESAELSELRVYGVSSGPLVDHLDLSIMRGAAGSTCAAPGSLTIVFDGRLADFGVDYATGSRGHRPNGSGAVVPYLVEVSLDVLAPNSAQGTAAELDVLWEVRGGNQPH